MDQNDPKNRERVLILAPIGQDARLAQSVLGEAGFTAEICEDSKALCIRFHEGAGALLIAEEALNTISISILRECLEGQPPWSDISLILMTNRSRERKSVQLINSFGENANIHLLERTFHPETLVSVIQMALRARRRQYEVCELLTKLNESEERFILAVKGSNVGIWEWDLVKDEIYLSSEWKAMLGEEGDRLTRDQWRRRLHPEDTSRVFEFMRNLKSDGGEASKNYELEYRLRHKDGFYRHVLSRGTVFFGKDNSAVRVAGSHIDITDRKRAEEALLKTTADLNASNEELEHFAYVASHDLQEPLRIISMYLEIFMDSQGDKLDEEAKAYIQFAREGAIRSQNLIHDLLQYARIGLKTRDFEDASLEIALRGALSNLKLMIMESGAEITHSTLPVVLVNPGSMVQLFQNLIGNALKYRSEKPVKINISCSRKENEWILGVHDNGIGIHPQYRERIFGIFQRLEAGKELSGTGIGLALCKKIVERHGGKIWVESEPGQGAVFYFSLPAALKAEIEPVPIQLNSAGN